MRIIAIIIFLINLNSSAQIKNEDAFSVEWLKIYSNEEDFGKKSNIWDDISNLLFGNSDKHLITPFNLLKLSDGSFFILDHGYNKPLICNSDGIQFADNSKESYYPSLVDVCKLNENKILFTDSKLKKIYLYDYLKDEIEEFHTSIEFGQPTGIACDSKRKRIYVSDTKNHTIAVIDFEGNLIRFLGNRGVGSSEFNYPIDLELDNRNNLLLIDALNFKLKLFTPNYELISSFGDAGDATGYFARPKEIAVDSYNHIYVVDALFHVVQIFDKDGNFLLHFGGQGNYNGKFWLPSGIYIDSNNHIFVADSYNSRIQEFRLNDGR